MFHASFIRYGHIAKKHYSAPNFERSSLGIDNNTTGRPDLVKAFLEICLRKLRAHAGSEVHVQ